MESKGQIGTFLFESLYVTGIILSDLMQLSNEEKEGGEGNEGIFVSFLFVACQRMWFLILSVVQDKSKVLLHIHEDNQKKKKVKRDGNKNI